MSDNGVIILKYADGTIIEFQGVDNNIMNGIDSILCKVNGVAWAEQIKEQNNENTL